MLSNVLPRMLFLSLVFAIFEYKAIIPIMVIFLILALFAYKDIKKETSNLFLAFMTSFLGPILVLNDFSWFFVRTSFLINTMYIFTIWLIYYGIMNFEIIKQITVFECFGIDHSNMTLRCLKINGSFSNCSEGFWTIVHNTNQNIDTVTVCPDKWKYLFLFSCVLTGLLIGSLLSLYFLHLFLNPITKMRIIKKMSCSRIILWKDSDNLLEPYVNKLLDGTNFNELNNKANEDLGMPLLELFVESRHHNLVKVKLTIYRWERCFR